MLQLAPRSRRLYLASCRTYSLILAQHLISKFESFCFVFQPPSIEYFLKQTLCEIFHVLQLAPLPVTGQVVTVTPCWFETHYLHFNGS